MVLKKLKHAFHLFFHSVYTSIYIIYHMHILYHVSCIIFQKGAARSRNILQNQNLPLQFSSPYLSPFSFSKKMFLCWVACFGLFILSLHITIISLLTMGCRSTTPHRPIRPASGLIPIPIPMPIYISIIVIIIIVICQKPSPLLCPRQLCILVIPFPRMFGLPS